MKVFEERSEIDGNFQKIKLTVTSEGKTRDMEGEYVLVVVLNQKGEAIESEAVGQGKMNLQTVGALDQACSEAVAAAFKSMVSRTLEATIKKFGEE